MIPQVPQIPDNEKYGKLLTSDVKYGYIYKTTNLINDKIYIGQHKSQVFEGTKYLGSGKSLNKAICKYGKENFKVELLEWCETKEQLNEREIYWISFFNSREPTMGYNITIGGEGNTDWSEEDRLAQSNRLKEKPKPLGFGNIVSLKLKNHPPTTHTQLHSNETKANMSKSRKGKKLPSHSKEANERQSKRAKLNRWYTNGINCVWCEECPDGYWPGRIIKHRKSGYVISENARKNMRKPRLKKDKINKDKKDKIQINDGVNIKFIYPEEAEEYLNAGWVKGRPNIKRCFKTINKEGQTLFVPVEELQTYINEDWALGKNKKEKKIWIKRDNECIMIKYSQLQEYLDKGWVKGRNIQK